MNTFARGGRTRHLVIFLKEPRPGRVKTRLASNLGTVRAARWYRIQSQAVIRRIGHDGRWRTTLAVDPDIEGLTSRIWPVELHRMPQGSGDLGRRMARTFRTLPPGPVVIVGSDIPGITPAHVHRAFRMLGRNDAVFGPSPDGGYWLIGLSRTRTVSTKMLRNVRWSSRHALSDSIASLRGLRTATCDVLIDVDDEDDLRSIGRGRGMD